MSTHRVTVRYRAVVLQPCDPLASSVGGSELPLSFPSQLDWTRAKVIPLFKPTSTFSSESMPTQSVPLSIPTQEASTASCGALTWTFTHVLESTGGVTLGRTTPTDVLPMGSAPAAPLLQHAYASRQQLKLYAKPVHFGYNKSAETIGVAVQQLGKNPTFVDSTALRSGEERTIRLFDASAGATGFASLEALRAAEQQPPPAQSLDASPWACGCADARFVAPVRYVVACRLSFPKEFPVLPVVLVVAEVVMPRIHSAPPAQLAPTMDVRLPASDDGDGSTVTEDDGVGPASAAPKARLRARSPSKEHEVAPVARRQPRSELAGFTLMDSSDDDDETDGAAARAVAIRRMESVTQQAPAPAEPASILAGLTTTNRQVRSSTGTAPRASSSKAPAPRKQPSGAAAAAGGGGGGGPEVAAPSQVRVASRKADEPPAADPQPPALKPALSVVRVGSSDDLLIPPRPPRDAAARSKAALVPKPVTPASSSAAALSGGAAVWQWKSKRSAPDSDDGAWSAYSEVECQTIEAASARGDATVKLGTNIDLNLRSSQQVSRSTGATRRVRRLAPGSGAAAPVGQGAGAPAQPAGRWLWNSNLHVSKDDPRAWAPYNALDAAMLEAAYVAGQSTCKLNASYSVAFNDKVAGLVQYRNDDASRWRSVRRDGGPPLPAGVRHARVSAVPGSSSDDESSSASWATSGSDDDEYSDVVSDSGSSGFWGSDDDSEASIPRRGNRGKATGGAKKKKRGK